MPNGLLLINKPVGRRSAECVARIKRIVGKNTRVGHAGTLDSTASGLLILLLGSATRLSDYVMMLPKVYEAGIRLGIATDTCDGSGEIVFRGDAAKVDDAVFDGVLYSFQGERMQVPPGISALKTGGSPLHRLTRAGADVRPAARPVTMTSIKRCSPVSEGYVKITVTCGKGTYIRGLVRDIGTKLGCGAHVAELRRLSTGFFCVADAESPEILESGDDLRLRSPGEVGAMFHRIMLTPEAERNLLNGLRVPLATAGRYVPGCVDLSKGLYVEGENMIGFAGISEDNADGVSCLKPETNIPGIVPAGFQEMN